MDALQQPIYEFGPFRLDSAEHSFLKDGQALPLPPTAFDILALLIENRGRVLSKGDLMECVWPDTFVDENNLAQQISVLRKVLGENPEHPHYIETVPRVGYRFIGEARLGTRRPDVFAASTPEVQPSGPNAVPFPPKKGVRPRIYWISGAIVAVLAVMTVYVQGRRQSGVSAANPKRIRSLVVLPLTNLSGDATQSYFVDAMTDSLTTDLAQVHELRVISGTSATHYKGTLKTLPEIARELQVDGVVEGTVFRSGDRVRITAQLIEAPADHHVWARSYERDMRDVIRMQDEVARDIANEIQVHLTPQEKKRLASAPAVDTEAYQLYLQGEYFETKVTEDFLRKAIGVLEQSIARDPDYAPAHVALATAYETFSTNGYGAPAIEYPKAERELMKALELDETLAEAHAGLANAKLTFDWDWAGAERETQRALELNPNSAGGHSGRATALLVTGHFEEATAEMRRTQALDPVGVDASLYVGESRLLAGQFDQGIEELQKTLELDPNFLPAHAEMAFAYARSGMRAEAKAEYEQTRRGMASRQALILDQWMAPVEILLGKRAEAARNAEWWSKESTRRYVDAYILAAFYAELGMKDRSFSLLEKGFAEHSPSMTYLKVDPNFPEGMRRDPRFAAMLRRMNFPN